MCLQEVSLASLSLCAHPVFVLQTVQDAVMKGKVITRDHVDLQKLKHTLVLVDTGGIHVKRPLRASRDDRDMDDKGWRGECDR